MAVTPAPRVVDVQVHLVMEDLRRFMGQICEIRMKRGKARRKRAHIRKIVEVHQKSKFGSLIRDRVRSQFSPPYLEDGSEAQRRQRAHDNSAAAADVISSFTFPGTYTRCQHPQYAHLFYPLADSGTGIDFSLSMVSPFMNPAEFGLPSFPPVFKQCERELLLSVRVPGNFKMLPTTFNPCQLDPLPVRVQGNFLRMATIRAKHGAAASTSKVAAQPAQPPSGLEPAPSTTTLPSELLTTAAPVAEGSSDVPAKASEEACGSAGQVGMEDPDTGEQLTGTIVRFEVSNASVLRFTITSLNRQIP
ncbi:hypothetical protein B0H13DRAFT_1904086 [Mycena leptocephala]|nr:hypothetical protein B0H13DRAFT_1904086 [Mycena leptocephala]